MMRTRQKLTVVGALALATSAIGGGVLMTSRAMAADVTPTKGTITVVALHSGADQAVRCTYDDVDLPTAPPGRVGTGVGIGVGEGGPGVGGPVTMAGGGALTVSGSAEGADTGATWTSGDAPLGAPPDGAVVHSVGTPLPGLPALALDSADARTGTAEECAALRPTVKAP